MTIAPQHELLTGVRVLDLSMFLSGPFACHQLADLGAEIIKVEPPGGDPSRLGSVDAATPPKRHFSALQAGRNSVVLDLKVEAARSVLRELIARSDVLVQNFRPGVAARLGVGNPEVREINPQIIHCEITGSGLTEPGGGPAIDGVVQAMCGALELTGERDGFGLPMRLTVADLVGGTMAVGAIVAALHRRTATGVGAHLDLSMVECLLQWIQLADTERILDPPATQLLQAADGKTLLVQAPMHFRDKFLALVRDEQGRSVAEDPRFATPELTAAHQDEFAATLASIFATRPSAAWQADLDAAGVPAMVIATIDEALTSPLVERRGAASDVVIEGRGVQRMMRSPFVIDGARADRTGPPAVLGADTRQVLEDLLGYDEAGLARLAAAGAFGGGVLDSIGVS